MTRLRLRILAGVTAAVFGYCGSAANAAPLYEQTFVPQGSAITASGWSLSTPAANWYSGTFAYGITDSATTLPINGQNPLYIGAGSANGITGENGMFYVTNGNGGFSSINPLTNPGLALNIYANLQGGGASDQGFFAVQVGGNWYASATAMATPTSSNLVYDLRSMSYNPAAANWNTLTVTPTLVTIGATAGANLSGPITGVGVVHQITNPANDYSSWNYADFSITAVPEPTSAVLTAVGIVIAARGRGRRK